MWNNFFGLCSTILLIASIHILNARPPTTTVIYLRTHDGEEHVFVNETIKHRPSTTAPRKLHSTPHPKNRTKTRILTNSLNHRKDVTFSEHSEQEIIFPDAFENLFEPVPRIDGAPRCASGGQTFCEKVEEYPYVHLKHILELDHKHNEFFGKDDEEPEIANRIGEGEEDISLCSSRSHTVYPEIAKNKNDKWKYVVNLGQNDKFIQGIRVETCIRENVPCDKIADLAIGFTTFCKQKYINRRLIALTENGGTAPDTFPIPAGCCCSIKRDVDFLTRFGNERNSNHGVTPIPTSGTNPDGTK